MKLQRAVRLPGAKFGRWETVATDGNDPISPLYRELISLFKTGTIFVDMHRRDQQVRYRLML